MDTTFVSGRASLRAVNSMISSSIRALVISGIGSPLVTFNDSSGFHFYYSILAAVF